MARVREYTDEDIDRLISRMRSDVELARKYARERASMRKITIEVTMRTKSDEAFAAVVNALKSDIENMKAMANMLGDGGVDAKMRAVTPYGHYDVNVDATEEWVVPPMYDDAGW